MTDARWQDVKALFHAALERPPGERAAFLAAATGGDEMLRREVELLLAADDLDIVDGFVDRCAASAARLAGEPPTSIRGGTRIGAYEVVALIGAGGMGEVYRAHDGRLGRDVALKLLPGEFELDPDRVARFRREAKVLASLNHPHIAAIYGIEETPADAGPHLRALVLELVEGETLAERIARSCGPTGPPLRLEDVLDIARQIADALDAAHEKGIVHRDLKPANIKITPQGVVKVLDFGLAKLEAGGKFTEAPTITVNDTREGLIVGTAAYMSPEQARGQAVDKRTDIWAFGCILYEMLTGRAAFGAATVSDTIAALLEREPNWQALPAATPSSLRRLLRRSLEKDVDRRLRDIGDVTSELAEALTARRLLGIGPRLWMLAGLTTAIALIAGVVIWLRSERPVLPNRSEWVQLTKFADSATQPALSPDGRLLTFIRGSGTFTTPGEIYVKLLPNGEPTPLTHDNLVKMSPVFSPDGARIAYTVRNTSGNTWDTWVVPSLRGEPRPWLRNASGLTWIGPNRILFSEIKSGQHMAIVSSTESRTEPRDLYVPPQQNGMAHRSYRSPDGKFVLIVEMDQGSQWLSCRLLPVDAASAGTPVGPRGSRCTGAAWSPDQRWMYFNADAGDGFHIWRQRFPDGPPESLASGPTEEEGLAIDPDGRSVITSVGLRQRAIWIHDDAGERQVSLEGYAFWPILSADGRKVCYRIASTTAGGGHTPSELWMTDLAGENQRLLPGLIVTGFDLSRDDRIVASVVEADGKSRLWLASLDGHAAPRRIAGAEGDSPVFGLHGEIFFRAAEGGSVFLFRVEEDGTARQKISRDAGIDMTHDVSPDDRWVTATGSYEGAQWLMAYSTDGNAQVRLYPNGSARWHWSPDGRRVYLTISTSDASAAAFGRTYVLPLPAGSMLPRVPPGGFRTEAELAAVPGVEVLPIGDLAPGVSPAIYAFSRETDSRNLYRIPLP
jgi:serine/threonine protein kinase